MHVRVCYTKNVISPNLVNRKGVFNVEFLISLIVAVMAGVISHLICKWLDSDKK